MRIDYTKTRFKLFAGDGFEITDFANNIKIGLPDPDPGQILTWQGTIEVDRNLKAIRMGLTDAAFDPRSFPLRWRPDRPMTLQLFSEGRSAIIPLRISKYAYSASKQKGTANVVQILDALSKDRPAESPEFKIDRANGGSEIALVIQALLKLAYKDSALTLPAIDTTKIWGKIEDDIATRNPINSAADLGASCWTCLNVRSDESLEYLSLDPLKSPVLFRRSLGSIELEPEMTIEADWKSKVILTGHYQKAAVPECGEKSGFIVNFVDKKGLDDKNRPVIISTDSKGAYAKVFPGSGNASTALVTSERKTIITQYGDADDHYTLGHIWQRASDGFAVSLDGDPFRCPNPDVVIAEIPAIKKQGCASGVVATLTVTSKPFAAIFPDRPFSADYADIWVESVELQCDSKKVIWQCRGKASPATLGLILDLVIASKEEVLANSGSRPGATEGGLVDKNDPNKGTKCLEPAACPEERQPMPDYKMTTEAVRGECAIVPSNWQPLIKLPLVQDMGFVPSQKHADILACQVAAKHVRKGDAHTCEMPVPIEWLAAGCPPIFRFHYHDREYEAVGVAIEITDKYQKITCDALGMGIAPMVPMPPAQEPYIPGFQIIGANSIVGFSGDTFAGIQLSAVF